jgi:hypothetical protein
MSKVLLTSRSVALIYYSVNCKKRNNGMMYLIKAFIDTLFGVDVSAEDKNIRPFYVKHFIG